VGANEAIPGAHGKNCRPRNPQILSCEKNACISVFSDIYLLLVNVLLIQNSFWRECGFKAAACFPSYPLLRLSPCSRPIAPGHRSMVSSPVEPAAMTPDFIASYRQSLDAVWQTHDWSDVMRLAETLRECWREGRQVFLCGNGGSAANAIHLANDYLYGIDKPAGHGLRVIALPANAAVLTCLANDLAYEDVFAQQLTVLARPGDVLIALSGSGNSPNIIKALTRARELGVASFAILGFTGGQCLRLADHPIHFPIHDMQVAEDLQMMVGHMLMQWLSLNHP
jgi:D-sedoheptulose 7-phosphate isomerase